MPAIPQLVEPDLMAPRGTDQWRDLVHQRKQQIAEYLTRGGNLDDLFGDSKYGEIGSPREGRLSHDYEYWQKALRGEALGDEGLPSELGEAEWNVGNFKRQINAGDFTEWPPGSGKFFNDPANDQGARQWFNQFGDQIPPPEDPGPNIDYNIVNEGYGGSIKNYLKGEAELRQREKQAKPLQMPGPNNNKQVPNPNTLPEVNNNPGIDQVWGGFGYNQFQQPNNQQNMQPNNQPGDYNKPKNNAANMQGALTGNPVVPSRFNAIPALTGENNNLSNPQSRVPKNPFGTQKPRRNTFGLGWS